MRPWTFAACAGALVLLSGCDAIRGVHTYADLRTMPDVDCVDATLRRLPGIAVLKREGDAWTYKANGVKAILQISRTSQEVRYDNGDRWMGRPPPATDMDAIEPTIKTVDTAVFSGCRLQAKTPSVHERVS